MPYAYPTVSLGGNNVEVYQATADVDEIGRAHV